MLKSCREKIDKHLYINVMCNVSLVYRFLNINNFLLVLNISIISLYLFYKISIIAEIISLLMLPLIL